MDAEPGSMRQAGALGRYATARRDLDEFGGKLATLRMLRRVLRARGSRVVP